MSDATIRELREVGRYAVGIDWSDGHDSILPFRDLRRHCPCDICSQQPATRAEGATEVADFQRLGENTLFFRWADGHETLLVGAELRALCRCAYCAGEPNYPITKQ